MGRLKLLLGLMIGFGGVTYLLSACSSDGSTSASTSSGTCTATDNTSVATTNVNGSGCDLLTMDTTSCQTSRKASCWTSGPNSGDCIGVQQTQWLKFSCNVTLSAVTTNGTNYVSISTNSEPNYKTLFWGTSHACYSAYTLSYPDPNNISAQSIVMKVPYKPSAAPGGSGGTAMPMGAMGVAVDGPVIFDPVAAGSDNIFDEAGSFDQCNGHPQDQGMYHHHVEPPSVSYNDDNFIGVLADGYFVYGRKDHSGATAESTTSATDCSSGKCWSDSLNGHTYGYYGGHVGPLPDETSTTAFHYHAHALSGRTTAQISAGSGSTTGYFLSGTVTTGTSAVYPLGVPAGNFYGSYSSTNCTGCH